LGKFLSDYLVNKYFFVFATTRNKKEIKDSKNLRFFYLDLMNYNSIASLVEFLEIEK
jgi:hypothetical protein